MSNDNSNGSSTPNDQFATTQTNNYIASLKAKWNSAELQLKKHQTSYNNLKVQKKNLGDELMGATALAAHASDNLKEGEKALENISAIRDFFLSRKKITKELVSISNKMALAMYEATQFAGEEGLDRVEQVLDSAEEYNSGTVPEGKSKWTDPFMDKVRSSDALGQNALKAAIKASESCFKAVISNQQLDFQTQQYFTQFASFEKQLREIVDRLQGEAILMENRMNSLKSKLDVVDSQVDALSAIISKLEFEVDYLHAEYTAAQQGAAYTVPSSKSPVS